MLPDFRFIAISVFATIAMVMLGFGLFATFRLANQTSGALARGGEGPLAPGLVERPSANPVPPWGLIQHSDERAAAPRADDAAPTAADPGRAEVTGSIGGSPIAVEAADGPASNIPPTSAAPGAATALTIEPRAVVPSAEPTGAIPEGQAAVAPQAKKHVANEARRATAPKARVRRLTRRARPAQPVAGQSNNPFASLFQSQPSAQPRRP